MVFAIVLMILFLIVVSVVFTFIFEILVSSIRAQNISFNKPIFSENEIRVRPSLMENYKDAGDSKAVVLCSSKKVCAPERFSYSGPKKCSLFVSMSDTEHDCKFACIGFGDCISACSRNAIFIENKTAVINELCNGCGKCIDSCPKGIIKLVPAGQEKMVLCSAPYTEKTKCSDNLKELDIYYGQKKI